MSELLLDPKSSALVFIDLQNGIMAMKTAPYSTEQVLSHCSGLAAKMRSLGGTVVYVHVDVNDMLNRPTDAPGRDPKAAPLPASAFELSPGSGYQEGDLLIAKRSWGAFYGTALDQQLRRRKVRTIILAGVATNMGVESTARAAFDREYELIFAEDATSSISSEGHAFCMKTMFPRMGRVRTTEEILKALEP